MDLIHFGLPRCASTSMQVLLSEISHFPHDAPLFYPSFSRCSASSSYGHNKAVEACAESSEGLYIASRLSQGLVDEIVQLHGLKPYIISAEDLWRCDPVEIHTQLAAAGLAENLRPIYSKRPFFEWIKSIYRHNIHMINLPFSEFLYNAMLEVKDCRYRQMPSLYDTCRVNRWSEVFGKEAALLAYPPNNSPLVEIAVLAEIKPIPSEWHCFSIHLNASQPSNVQGDSEYCQTSKTLGERFIDEYVELAVDLNLIGNNESEIDIARSELCC